MVQGRVRPTFWIMYYAYILKSKRDGTFYIGYTNNLKRRFLEHNSGLVTSTKTHLPFDLVYYEGHRNRKDAIKREAFLKTGWGRNYIKRVLSNYLLENK